MGRSILGLGRWARTRQVQEVHMPPPAVGGAGGASGALVGALAAPGHGVVNAQGGPAPGRNGGGDEVLVSVRAEEHPTLPEGRGHGDRGALGRQPSAAEPPKGRRQDIIVPRPSQTDVRGRHQEVTNGRVFKVRGWLDLPPSKGQGRKETQPKEQVPREFSYATLGTSTPLGHASLGTVHSSESPAKRYIGLRRGMSPGENTRPAPDPSGADMSKYCKYHRCHGHNTNDCQAWRKEIERLIQAGKLGNFIDWDRMARRDTRGRGATPQIPQTGKEKDRDESNRPVINVIFGGETLGEHAFVGAVDDRLVTKKP
nr:Transposon Ty3-G Gag-Pol polyprotein [Ipomoea batatas]